MSRHMRYAQPDRHGCAMGQPGEVAATADEEQFREQLVDCIPQLMSFARSLTRSRDSAEDLTQDTCSRALAAYKQFQPGTNLRAWLMTILRNQHISELRKNRPTVPDDEIIDSISTPANQHQAIELAEVNEAMSKMADHHREVLLLVAVSEMNQEEAAALCRCAIGTIKSRLSRARAELQTILAGESTTKH